MVLKKVLPQIVLGMFVLTFIIFLCALFCGNNLHVFAESANTEYACYEIETGKETFYDIKYDDAVSKLQEGENDYYNPSK